MRGLWKNRRDARSLSDASGHARTIHETFEMLEERKLLFALTITQDSPIDPATGLRQVSAAFGYAIPYLASDTELEDGDIDDHTWDFNDNLQPGVVGSGTFYAEDGGDQGPYLRITHDFNAATGNFRLAPEDPTDTDPTELRLDINATSAGRTWTFQVMPEDNVGAFPLVLNTFAFGFANGRSGDADGLSGADFELEVTLFDGSTQTFTGAALDGLIAAGGGGAGTFTLTRADLNDTPFTGLRFTSLAAEDLFVDDIVAQLVPGIYSSFVEEHLFGAEVVLTGPVGAQVQVFDLYGRDMTRTLAVQTPPQGNVPLIDPDDNGIPNFNDGIGRIVISSIAGDGVLDLTSVTVLGGTISLTEDPADDANRVEFFGGLSANYFRSDSMAGIFDQFEEAGFGYSYYFDDDTLNVAGLPPGAGSVIIGSPFVRDTDDQNSYVNGRPANILTTANALFTSPDQGVFVEGGSISSVTVHGVVHGVSRFDGAAGRINFGYLVGSAVVKGDLGYFAVGSDAGSWSPDQDYDPPFTIDPIYKTDGELVAERSLGEYSAAGRSVLDITVLGDVNDPDNRPPLSTFTYSEKEAISPVDPNAEDGEAAVVSSFAFSYVLPGADTGFFRNVSQPVVYGAVNYRNDSILNAEWIGSLGTGVRINGSLGGADPINADDPADVYAFASDGSTPILMELAPEDFAGGLAPVARIVDQDGRTLAANQFTERLDLTQFIRFEPTEPGVYYLVVSGVGITSASDGLNNPFTYSIVLTGMASTTMGLVRSGAGLGFGLPSAVTLTRGDAGAIISGAGIVGGDSSEGSPSSIINNANEDDEDDDLLTTGAAAITVPRSLFGFFAGSEVGAGITAPRFTVGADLGVWVTGLSPVAGGGGFSGAEGDVLGGTVLDVGGRIGRIDIRGAIGVDQDEEERPLGLGLSVRSGLDAEGPGGDIGMIRVGNHVYAEVFSLTTAPGSTVGAFLVSQDSVPTGDVGDSPGDDEIGFFGGDPDIVLGQDSDLRFADVMLTDIGNGVDTSFDLLGGQPVLFVDDAGGRVLISAEGAANDQAVGVIRVLSIDSSQGVAIAQIDDLDLTGGIRLRILSQGSPNGNGAPISIGRIIVEGADEQSEIDIDGDVEVDVWRIDQTGGAAFDRIRNNTPGGDIVAIDVVGLDRLEIVDGNLGSTQLVSYGPSRLGPWLGLASGSGTGVLDGLGINEGAMYGGWNGGTFRPITDVNGAPDNAYLDDIGSPLDGYLDGAVIRTGSVTLVEVSGSVGDLILQDQAGELIELIIDSDADAPEGEFHGLVGQVYAFIVNQIDLGMGIAAAAQTPFATAGVFAEDEIRELTVDGRAHEGAQLSGLIIANNIDLANSGPPGLDGFAEVGGIDRIQLFNADAVDLEIGTFLFDDFWLSAAGFPDNPVIVGDIADIQGDQADFIGSRITTGTLDSFELRSGVYDATVIDALADVGRIRAVEFRNSTITGEFLEFRLNQILVGQDIETIETIGLAGDISDLVIDVLGSITGRLAARDFVRVDLDVDNNATDVIATRNIVASSFVGGQFEDISVGGSLRASELFASGPLVLLEVTDEIYNTNINVTGPQGRIDRITARTRITGSITSSGPIERIETTEGDIEAFIRTTTSAGSVTEIIAARDLLSSTDFAANVDRLIVGRHVGRRSDPGQLVVRGTLDSLEAGAQLFSDLRVGQTINSITLGPVVNRPGFDQLGQGSIIASGRIETVYVVGDFDGNVISYSGGIGSVTVFGGSFLADNLIAAYDGDLVTVDIMFGNLYGDIHADYTLYFVTVTATPDGVFGDIGVNPFLSSADTYDNLRNQLPPGVAASSAIDGPSISAGRNLGRVVTTGGSMFEVTIHAGWAIGTISSSASIQEDGLSGPGSSVISARDSIYRVIAGTHIAGVTIIAGVRSFGADARPGGVGDNADVTNSGFIETVFAAGSLTNTTIVAGQTAGADGVYNTGDELAEPGVSFVRNVNTNGWVVNASVYSESLATEASAGGRAETGGFAVLINDEDAARGYTGTELVAGTPFSFSNGSGSGTILFNGAGRAFWDDATSRVIFGESNYSTTLEVTATNEDLTLTDFDIVSRNSASIRSLVVRANLEGDSDIYVDAYADTIITGHFRGTGSLKVGQHITNLITGSFEGAYLTAKNAAYVTISGNVGDLTLADPDPSVAEETRIDIYSSGFMTIGGGVRASMNVDRTIGHLTIGGVIDNARIRAGTALANVTAAGIFESRISASDYLDFLTVEGDVVDSQILIGGDLGDNAEFDADGTDNPFDADRATSGVSQLITITGDLVRSDIAGGGLRGTDGFFGTGDDTVTSGRALLGPVSVGGQIIGSNRDTESFRIFSTGRLGTVTAGGANAINDRNLEIERVDIDPLPIAVTSLTVSEQSGVFTARIEFNQPMDEATFDVGLVVSEVRGTGEAPISLINGVDYFLNYDDAEDVLYITFSTEVTRRDLPQLPGRPGPGAYRFELNAELIRAQSVSARLDGDGDGRAQQGDNYSQDTFVGDPGDKLAPSTVTVSSGTQSADIDFYGPASLDIVLDNNVTPDGLPDANAIFQVRGTIGDHPDNDTILFPFRGDIDVYSITLQAGQILRLGLMEGAALSATRAILNPDGELIDTFSETSTVIRLPGQIDESGDTFTETENILVKETGTYYIAIGNGNIENLVSGTGVNFVGAANNTLGSYAFTVQVFDDGDTGFDASTDAGDGRNLVRAPLPSEFAGPDGSFGTGDDFASITRGAYVFRLDTGADGVAGTSDDSVSGEDGDGGVSTSDTTGRRVVTVNTSIGDPGFAGLPGTVAPDIDVFHLNNHNPITAGTVIRATIKLADLGADLGSRDPNQAVIDYVGRVQFGLFDTTSSDAIDNAILVFSPSDFSPNGGTPGTLAQGDNATYGFDENGDFFIEFIAPERQDLAGRNASYALYVQGVYNTDYAIEVVTDGAAEFVERKQNVFLETRGGEIDWLQVAGQTTSLDEFDTGVLGFVGERLDGQSLSQYFIDSVISNLEAIFDDAGLDVNISTNPRDFEFEPFSTIFLTSSSDPINGATTQSFSGFGAGLAGAAFFDEPLGYAQHSDPFNADRSDEGVVFLPSFALFGFSPSEAGIEAFTSSLTAAVGRRIGELMGLRIGSDLGGTGNVNDIMAADSPTIDVSGGQTFGFTNADRALSFEADTVANTDFYLGLQNSGLLIDLITQDD